MTVLLLVDVTADPEQPDVQQPDRAGEDSRSTELVAAGHRRQKRLAHTRQRAREPLHVLELQMVLMLSPELVVEVLVATGRVDAHSLQMAEWVWADPHLLPGRRDRERAYAGQRLPIGDRDPAGVEVGEAGLV